MSNEFLNFIIISILVPLALVVIGTVIGARIKGIRFRSSPQAYRLKIPLLREITQGNQIYKDKDMFWKSERSNHDTCQYIRAYLNMRENSKYETIKPHLGIIPYLFWFGSIRRFVKRVDDLYGDSQKIDDVFGSNKVMFKLINKEHYDEVEPKEPFKDDEMVKTFTIRANKALIQYSKILKKSENFLSK